jgi:hypothetical protein
MSIDTKMTKMSIGVWLITLENKFNMFTNPCPQIKQKHVNNATYTMKKLLYATNLDNVEYNIQYFQTL